MKLSIFLEKFNWKLLGQLYKKISGQFLLHLEKYNAEIMQEYLILPKRKSVAITPALLLALWCWGNIFLEVPHTDADMCSTPVSQAKSQNKFDDRWEGQHECLACQ